MRCVLHCERIEKRNEQQLRKKKKQGKDDWNEMGNQKQQQSKKHRSNLEMIESFAPPQSNQCQKKRRMGYFHFVLA